MWNHGTKTVGITTAAGYNLILAGALVSITNNPLLFHAVAPLEARFARWAGTTVAQRDGGLEAQSRS